MLYSGFTETELKQITTILELHQVGFEISAYQEAIEVVDRFMKDNRNHLSKHGPRLDTSFYQIHIDQEALKKLPADVLSELEQLRIYREMEMLPPEEKPAEIVSTSIPKSPQWSNNNKFWLLLFLLVLGWMLYEWVDKYFLPIR